MRTIAVGLLWAALCGTANAAGDADPRGLDLLERCHQLEAEDAPGQERDHGYCLGYIVGFVSGFAARDVAGAGGRFCPPSDLTIADYARTIEQWLVLNPDGLDKMGALVALRAFQWKFPCDPETLREPGKGQ